MPADTTRIDELDQSILTLCTRINAATYELLVMIREFDERAGWLQWGLDNCAGWLQWGLDNCTGWFCGSRPQPAIARWGALQQQCAGGLTGFCQW